ncbi:hypothetical protein FGO68_gene5714 [Halteria grandinella]|uniref:Uncharacterized protein n=1 Tax=Halteria grandinella TaxID=5974 RepID=A0A8J8T7V3_HALGN|nr:hypothetical protein FGO68_gene5714 [Halteria grandinella]
MKTIVSPFFTKVAWVIGCSNMAMHQMVLLSFRNPTLEDQNESDLVLVRAIDEKLRKDQNLPTYTSQHLMDRAIMHQKTNALLLCMLGITHSLESVVATREFIIPIARRRVPHFIALCMLVNSIFFQSVSIYGTLISKDLSHAEQIVEATAIGDLMQVIGAVSLFLSSL